MKNILKIIISLVLIFTTGCLKDNIVPVVNFELDGTAKILRYLESQGDVVNTEAAPWLISATDVYNDLGQLFILDIRTQDEYMFGHIESSINVSSSRLYEVVDSLNTLFPLKKIVIVSKNGQSSSYFVSLLRLAGFDNIFTLNRGMAYWHTDFAGEWLQAIGNSDSGFNNYEYPKLPFSDLPKLEFPSTLSTEQEKTIYRIKDLIKIGFISGINYVTNSPSTYFVVCYGKPALYGAPRELGARGHPAETVWFWTSKFEFRSAESLQTLPNDRHIVIYSSDGQLSACMVAYLRVLGYDTKTLLFGANQLFYTRMNLDPNLVGDAFKTTEIMNYPYATGN
jgi:rhodanese-related sulfurtransferase